MFRTNAQNLTADTTILATENAQVTGPFTIDSSVTLTINSGGRLVISWAHLKYKPYNIQMAQVAWLLTVVEK